MRRGLGALLAVVFAAATAVSCGSSSGGSTHAMKVNLTEYSIKATPAHVKPGNVDIEARNTGGMKHELVVVRADGVASLPLAKDGTVDEDKIAETDKMGEMGDIPAGSTVSKTFDLPAGTYVMFCNIDEGTPKILHFVKGMSTQFTVGS
jgi:plastocyanin